MAQLLAGGRGRAAEAAEGGGGSDSAAGAEGGGESAVDALIRHCLPLTGLAAEDVVGAEWWVHRRAAHCPGHMLHFDAREVGPRPLHSPAHRCTVTR